MMARFFDVCQIRTDFFGFAKNVGRPQRAGTDTGSWHPILQLVSSSRQRYFSIMAERTSYLADPTAVLAFIFGAIVMVASIGSLLLTLLAIAGIHVI